MRASLIVAILYRAKPRPRKSELVLKAAHLPPQALGFVLVRGVVESAPDFGEAFESAGVGEPAFAVGATKGTAWDFGDHLVTSPKGAPPRARPR